MSHEWRLEMALSLILWLDDLRVPGGRAAIHSRRGGEGRGEGRARFKNGLEDNRSLHAVLSKPFPTRHQTPCGQEPLLSGTLADEQAEL